MAVILSKTMKLRIIDQDRAVDGNGIFTNFNFRGFTFGLMKSGSKTREYRLEFGDIRKFKNYGELLVKINDCLRALKLNRLVQVALGEGFPVLTAKGRVTGREIVFTSQTAAFSLQNPGGHNLFSWIPLLDVQASNAHKEVVLGTPVAASEIHPDPQSRYDKVAKHIVLPLNYISTGGNIDEDVSATPRTAIIETSEKTQRTAINASQHLNYNPEGTFDMAGNIPRSYERFINNSLLGISQRFMGQPQADVYVTNPLRRMDVVSIESGYLRFRKEQLAEYLEDTQQTGNHFKVGLVVETLYTVHTAYLELEVISDPEYVVSESEDGDGVKYPYAFARVMLGTMPITEQEIVYTASCFYPILIVYSTLNIQFKESSSGTSYTFSSMISPVENKRAVM